ncbi:hypothetical protein B0A49_08427 [Cryomyces minteri]|uniref:SprT-like domain-containing protein n=1 Tax=Cryomyces minteri TaxID=331657 RepID=A0A4U0WWS9_9PEZI|nr:hypothetical protein B0A49_08427 [Cryomyces minteri]
MARIHEDSDEELPDLDDIIKQHSQRPLISLQQTATTVQEPTTRSFRSPVKKQPVSQSRTPVRVSARNPSLEVTQDAASASLIPKLPSSETRVRRMRVLKPLRVLAENSLLLPIPKDAPSRAEREKEIEFGAQKAKETLKIAQPCVDLPGNSTPESPSRVPKHDTYSKAGSQEPIVARPTPAKRAKTSVQYGFPPSCPSGVTEDSDEDVTLWCGSESASPDDSDAEDGHAVEEILKRKPRTRSPRKAKPSAGKSDESLDALEEIAKQFADIDLAPGTFKLLSGEHPKQLQRLETSLPASSLPSSSSERENDNRAILRFSPPLPSQRSPRKVAPDVRPVTPPPASPSKSRLTSPSKKKQRIPTPPHRPSLDAFWSAEVINDWNDQYSPRKILQSPRKSRVPLKDGNDDAAFPSPSSSPRKSSPAKKDRNAMEARKQFELQKHQLASSFFNELDQAITNGAIAALAASTGGVRLAWSRTLQSTAGRANWRRETSRACDAKGNVTTTYRHHASIELAEKIIDDPARLVNVIAHEFCHLANFMVSGVKDQPHGKSFKEWGRKCGKAFADRGVEVTTKHSYAIDYKYIWECTECQQQFKRHSKSVDPTRHTCGVCKAPLVQIKPAPRKEGKGSTEYQMFVKERFSKMKKDHPDWKHGEIMQAIGKMYRERKEAVEKTIERPDDVVANVGDVARVLEFITIDDD